MSQVVVPPSPRGQLWRNYYKIIIFGENANFLERKYPHEHPDKTRRAKQQKHPSPGEMWTNKSGQSLANAAKGDQVSKCARPLVRKNTSGKYVHHSRQTQSFSYAEQDSGCDQSGV
ncbi:hypothetical protein BpHYR1_025649 [Brachionus plicatilis]|uniref:Uncharacterized protein n=1 Tax=Brachionus plicatilis TaxID=10195 RepID=A0A3M7SU85_BRAPC|nr:hypothetical protein BpHYR1_025649 [Brachionus plicatilis]